MPWKDMALTGSKGQENLITFLFFALFLAFLWRPKTFPILKPHIGNNFPIPINFKFNYLIFARLCHVYIHVNSANHTSAKRYRRITIRNITDLVPIFTWTSAQEGSEASAMPATQELQEISVGVKQLMDPEATYLNKSADWQNQLICQSADLILPRYLRILAAYLMPLTCWLFCLAVRVGTGSFTFFVLLCHLNLLL